MALREEVVIDKIEVRETGEVHVRQARRIYDGDELVAQTFHRTGGPEPGGGVTPKDARVQQIAGVVWTPEVIAAHEARRAARANSQVARRELAAGTAR